MCYNQYDEGHEIVPCKAGQNGDSPVIAGRIRFFGDAVYGFLCRSGHME